MTPLKLAEIAEEKYPMPSNDIKDENTSLTLSDVVRIRRAAFIAGDQRDRWISVEDELPEDHVEVLVWAKYWTTPIQALRHSGEWFVSREVTDIADDIERRDGSISGLKEFPITHWQPLPSPPSNP